jgi:hypothetical protein
MADGLLALLSSAGTSEDALPHYLSSTSDAPDASSFLGQPGLLSDLSGKLVERPLSLQAVSRQRDLYPHEP